MTGPDDRRPVARRMARRSRTHLTGDDDYEPTYRWAVIIIGATIICFALGALAMLGALRLAQSIN